MRLVIYIPAYNAAKMLPSVLDRLSDAVKDQAEEILVIDNASTDETSAVAQKYRDLNGLNKLTVIRNKTNLGYGGSQKQAYRYILDKGYEIVVLLHADGQYPPEQIPKMIEPIAAGQADVVLGTRLTGDPLAGGMPLYRYAGNKVLTFIENLVLGWNLTEYHTGFRAYRCASLDQLPFELGPDYYHFDVDILIQAKVKNLRVVEKAIDTHYGDEECHQNTWRTGISILALLAGYIMYRIGLRRSARLGGARVSKTGKVS